MLLSPSICVVCGAHFYTATPYREHTCATCQYEFDVLVVAKYELAQEQLRRDVDAKKKELTHE